MSKKKFPIQSVLFASALIICVVFAVMGFVFADYAETKFWWTAWPLIGVLSILAFISLIIWATSSKKKFDE